MLLEITVPPGLYGVEHLIKVKEGVRFTASVVCVCEKSDVRHWYLSIPEILTYHFPEN